MLTTLNHDHDMVIDSVTISLTHLMVHCNATHTCSPTILVESVCSSDIIQRWSSSTFINLPSPLNCPVVIQGSPSLPPHHQILVPHPTGLTGLDHLFPLPNLHRRCRNTNLMPLTQSWLKLYSLLGCPALKISSTTRSSST